MSLTMQLLLVAVAASLCLSEGAADGRVTRAKQQRPTRGFKNLEMMTARGFGKRGRPSARPELYNLDSFLESMGGSPEESQEIDDNKALDRIPIDWFVTEMIKNSDFTRSIISKFVDTNQDGQLSLDELFRDSNAV